MHARKFCIDGRAASEFECQGLIAQEVIDQMVAAPDEPNPASSEEETPPILLSHPNQVFSGQFERFDTRKRIGSSFFYAAWEKHFIETYGIQTFHRFRPADRLLPRLSCPTITTVLPARKTANASTFQCNENDLFIVPSQADKTSLQEKYAIQEEQIKVGKPTARRFIHFSENLIPAVDGQILFLTDGRKDLDLRKLKSIVSAQFPHLPLRTLPLSNMHELAPEQWIKHLKFTTLCFYLTDQAFDWPFLALEALFFEVPTIFMDNHQALNELLPVSPLRISRYLTDFTSSSQLKKFVLETKLSAEQKGAFDPEGAAKQYTEVYRSLQASLKGETPVVNA